MAVIKTKPIKSTLKKWSGYSGFGDFPDKKTARVPLTAGQGAAVTDWGSL
jgi:hypothetical protein